MFVKMILYTRSFLAQYYGKHCKFPIANIQNIIKNIEHFWSLALLHSSFHLAELLNWALLCEHGFLAHLLEEHVFQASL